MHTKIGKKIVDLFSKHGLNIDFENVLEAYIEQEIYLEYPKLSLGIYVLLQHDSLVILHYVANNKLVKVMKLKRENILSIEQDLFLDVEHDEWEDRSHFSHEYKKNIIKMVDGSECVLNSPKFEKGVHNYNEEFIKQNMGRYNNFMKML